MKILDRKLLAVEVAGEDIRAAVVAKKGKSFEILDFAMSERPDPDDDLPAVEAVKALATRMNYTAGEAVYVTPLARAFEISMNRKKISKMKHYQLIESVKWEVEPYTGVTGMQALIGVVKEDRAVEPGMMPEPDEEDITVNVSVLEKNIYRAIKERFKAAGFRLVRIYPPDVCFYMPVFMEAFEAPRGILDIGKDYSNFAILKGEKPSLINTLPISMEAIVGHLTGENPSEELENNIKYTARQTPEPLPLIISGAGAGDRGIVDYISSLCANGAEPLAINKTAGLKGSIDDRLNAVYGTVVGAGIRELKSKKERRIGISDAEPLVPRLKKSAYLMPLVATVLLFVLLFGHFQYMKLKEKSFKLKITKLSADLKKKKERRSTYDLAVKEAEDLKKEIDFTNKKIAFATGKADEGIAHVINLYMGLAGLISENIVLENIIQENILEYKLSGKSFDLSSVGGFATGIQKKKWCESVVIKTLEKAKDSFGFEFFVKSRMVKG